LSGGGDLVNVGVEFVDRGADSRERFAGSFDRGCAVVGALGAVADGVHDALGLLLDLADQRRDAGGGAP
jgi:hypothetical protein